MNAEEQQITLQLIADARIATIPSMIPKRASSPSTATVPAY